MPWDERTTMSERRAFVEEAIQGNSNVSQLCRQYGISRKTGYKWLRRYKAQGVEGLEEHSRRPKHSPRRTLPETEQVILRLRQKHPAWGGRKLRARLQHLGELEELPSASTITAILRRHGQLDPQESQKRQRLQRFEKKRPNEMWQIDFKGDFPIGAQACHTLTVLDDHSRYLVGLFACPNQQKETVQAHLTSVFHRYGLPDSILCDNGPPWGSIQHQQGRFTRLNLWWLRLGIRIRHSRPYHPQTLGKDERLHRSLNDEVLKRQRFGTFSACQQAFQDWQSIYNQQRPHEALELDIPANRYQRSRRPFPEKLPPVDYAPGSLTRLVGQAGYISFQGKRYRVGRAFAGHRVGLVADPLQEGVYEVHFCQQLIKIIRPQAKVEC